MEKEATIVDDHDDDVFDANASGDEFTDCPGVLCHKTTRDQFLSWEYTGISPSMWSLSVLLLKSLSRLLYIRSGLLLYIRSRLLKPVDHSSVLCITTTTTTCYYMWQLGLIPAMTVLYDVMQTLP